MGMAGLTISRFAAAEGVGVETVRFYQRQGLLAVPERQGSGGRLTAAQRASQAELMRAAAAEAGRNPAALEYTRWGSTGLSAADIQAHARNGTTRLVVAPSSIDLAEQRAEISAFADRLRRVE
jgi:hypothetical protein